MHGALRFPCSKRSRTRLLCSSTGFSPPKNASLSHPHKSYTKPSYALRTTRRTIGFFAWSRIFVSLWKGLLVFPIMRFHAVVSGSGFDLMTRPAGMVMTRTPALIPCMAQSQVSSRMSRWLTEVMLSFPSRVVYPSPSE